MKGLVNTISSMCLIGGMAFLPLKAEEKELDRAAVLKVVKRIEDKYSELTKEVDALKGLLGLGAKTLTAQPIVAKESFKERVKVRTEDGMAAYKKGDYQEAKDAFQKAWELNSDHYITNFNLGLAYYQLDNVSLAKKMFKSALDLDENFEGSSDAKSYLNLEAVAESGEEDKVDEKLRTKVVNLRKEAESYMRSKRLDYPQRMAQSMIAFNEVIESAKGTPKLVEDHYPSIAEAFEAFGLFDKAQEALKEYEEAMKGKILPDGHHARTLRVEEKLREQKKVLANYRGAQPEKETERRLTRNLQELGIFATQMDQFVKDPNMDDADFAKICQRLAEFRWGNRANRHVIVMSRYQELLYSNLPGTLPVDRYQDAAGEKFFQNITFLAEDLKLKESEICSFRLTY